MGDIITGARARLEVEGIPVGFCTGVSIEETVEHQPVEVLDEIRVREHVPVAYRVNVSATKVRVFKKTATTFGFGFNLDDLKAGGTPLTMVIIDSVTGKSIGRVTDAKPEGRTQRIDARAITMVDVRFNAVLFEDETQQAQAA